MKLTDIIQLYIRTEIENGNDGVKVLFNAHHLRKVNSLPPDVSAFDALNDYMCSRDTWRKKVVLSSLYIKQITNIMKY